MSKQTEHVHFVLTLSKGQNFTKNSFYILAKTDNKVKRCFDFVACYFNIVDGVDEA